MMERIHRNDPELVVRGIHSKNRKFPTLGQIGWPRVRELMEQGVYGFTFVRDPFQRVVSAYQDKMGRAKYRREINAVLSREPDRDVSFDQFLDALEVQNPGEMNPHWRPQHMVLMADEIKYDYIGRVETISEDLEKIREASGLPNVGLEHRNKSERNGRDVDVTAERRSRIEKIYAEDFERFGY